MPCILKVCFRLLRIHENVIFLHTKHFSFIKYLFEINLNLNFRAKHYFRFWYLQDLSLVPNEKTKKKRDFFFQFSIFGAKKINNKRTNNLAPKNDFQTKTIWNTNWKYLFWRENSKRLSLYKSLHFRKIENWNCLNRK